MKEGETTEHAILRYISARVDIVAKIRHDKERLNSETVIAPIGHAVDAIEESLRALEGSDMAETLATSFDRELKLWEGLRALFTARQKLKDTLEADVKKYTAAKQLGFSASAMRELQQTIDEVRVAIDAMKTLIDEKLDDIVHQLGGEETYVKSHKQAAA